MELLPPTMFASIVASNKDLLKELSQLIKKYCGEKISKDFNQACNKLDFDLANRSLDDLIEKLTDLRSVSLSLSEYANKFSDSIPNLDDEVHSVIGEMDKVKEIDKYYDKIKKIILTANLNEV